MIDEGSLVSNQAILKLRGITKRFPGVIALKGINEEVYRGEVHALVGENGAGKSTLIKILAGVYRRDEGEIYLENRSLPSVYSPDQAHQLGLGFVHQELNLVPGLNAIENMTLGLKRPKRFGLISWKKVRGQVEEIVKGMSLDIDLKRPVKDLPAGQQSMIAIGKALLLNAKIIVMDEPTASLTESEVKSLFEIIHNLRKAGVAILYVSHRLEEIFKIADVVTVFKDGEKVGSYITKEVDKDKLVSLMIGKDLTKMYPKERVSIGETLLSVRNLERQDVLKNISFDLAEGEILGVTGLLGSGRTDLARAIFGADKIDSGEIYLKKQRKTLKTPKDGISYGLAFLPERRGQGAVISMKVRENITLASLKNVLRWRNLGLISSKKEKEVSEDMVHLLSIRTNTIEQKLQYLSGGNQQKVILGKWLCTNARVFIFDEPTTGIDVGAKSEIYKLIEKLAKDGAGVILISSDLEEILGICDRVLVMREGEIAADLSGKELSEAAILHYYFQNERNGRSVEKDNGSVNQLRVRRAS